jgi:hypothetical protein
VAKSWEAPTVGVTILIQTYAADSNPIFINKNCSKCRKMAMQKIKKENGKTANCGQRKGPGKEPGTAPSAGKACIDDPINQGQKSKLTNVNKNMALHYSQGGRRPCQYFAVGRCRTGNAC